MCGMPLARGDSLKLVIENINSLGQGVARWGAERFVVFVPGALPGETVRGTLVQLKKQYGVVEFSEIIETHPGRVDPLCPHFSECGGCSLQHAGYDTQLRLKEEILRSALERIGGISEPPVENIRPSPSEWGYRNKASFPVRRIGKRNSLGFYRRASHSLVPVRECPVLESVLGGMLPGIDKIVSGSGVTAYDERKARGLLRHIVLRGSRSSSLPLVVPVLNSRPGSRLTGSVEIMARSIVDELAPGGLCFNFNTGRGNTIFGPRSQLFGGESSVVENMAKREIAYGPTSFFQVNTEQAIELFSSAASEANAGSGRAILELYAGVGAMSLFLLDRGARVKAVESHPEAARFMKENFRRNGFPEGCVRETRAENALSEEKCDCVVVDPPRSGLGPEVVRGISTIKTERMVYVSCNPATLARDAKLLTEAGFRAKNFRPFDMFPQTAHVECLAVFVRE